MADLPALPHFFACLHDEKQPVGDLGRGTHYSIFRSLEWHDAARMRIDRAQFHDFAVIWDEDHDTRVYDVVEQMYVAGLLAPVKFVGERKGMLTVLVSSVAWSHLMAPGVLATYRRELERICGNVNGDSWNVEVGYLIDPPTPAVSSPGLGSIINDAEWKVSAYLQSIDVLWTLGSKAYVPERRPDPSTFEPTTRLIFGAPSHGG